MPHASYLQASFVGGEWAPEMQGRSDLPAYKAALNKAVNYYPTVQGALTRRQGFQRCGYTRMGGAARLVGFDISTRYNSATEYSSATTYASGAQVTASDGNVYQSLAGSNTNNDPVTNGSGRWVILPSCPVVLEFSNSGSSGYMRIWRGDGVPWPNGSVKITSISTATPAVVTTSSDHGFSSNDFVFFTLRYTDGPDAAPAGSGIIGRPFQITKISNTTFSLQDGIVGGNVDGTTLGWTTPGSGTYYVTRITELSSPYNNSGASGPSINGDWQNCTFCQDEAQLIICHPKYAPRQLIQTAGSGTAGFTLQTLAFLDGPYLDLNTTTTTLTPSAISGSITVTASSTTGINGGSGFLSNDVGRHIRIKTEAPNWDPTSNAYVVGSIVLYTDGNTYVALKNTNGPAANGGVAAPPGNIDHWSLVANAASWVWGVITAVADTTHCTVQLKTSTQSNNASLYTTNATTEWQLGLYGGLNGWPTNAEFHENRLWFSGVIANRRDGSMVGLYGTFSPTADDGTVGDANAVASVAKASQNNPDMWLASDDQGMLIGTLTCEIKLKASALDDPITPSNQQVRLVSSNGSAAGFPDPFGTVAADGSFINYVWGEQQSYGVQPVRAGRMHVFVQRMQRKLIEIGHPTELGSFYTPNLIRDLSQTAMHLSITGIQEIAYTQEPRPFIWSRRRDGKLVSVTYSRDGENLIAGWHQHPLGYDTTFGKSRFVRSITASPSPDQLTDHVWAVTTASDT